MHAGTSVRSGAGSSIVLPRFCILRVPACRRAAVGVRLRHLHQSPILMVSVEPYRSRVSVAIIITAPHGRQPLRRCACQHNAAIACLPVFHLWSLLSMQCPVSVTSYAAQARSNAQTATTVVAVISAVVVCGYIAVLYLRPTPRGTHEEETVEYLVRVNMLRLLLSVVGLSLSFSFLSSAMSAASAGVALAVMRDLPTAVDISFGRLQSSCSHPLHAANLAIDAAVFSILELVIFSGLDYVVVPDLWPTLITSQTTYDLFYYSAAFARSRYVPRPPPAFC